MEQVAYQFSCDTEQQGPWVVDSVAVKEGLSVLYSAEVVLVAERNADDAGSGLLGASCTLDITRRGRSPRRLCGIVHRVTHKELARGQHKVTVTFGPALLASCQSSDARVFTGLSVPDIVSAVIGQQLEGYDRRFAFRLLQRYPERECCVQYNEPDWAFVARLLAQEGINFYFEHGPEQELVVFCDDNASFLPLAGYGGSGDALAVGGPAHADEHISTFSLQRRQRATAVSSSDLDWSRPRMSLQHRHDGQQDGRGRERELYRHSDSGLHGYEDRAYQLDVGQQRVKVEAERQAMEGYADTGGTSSVTALRPGATFVLVGQAAGAAEARYVVTEVQHAGRRVQAAELASDDASNYHNEFVCLPYSTACRPAAPAAPPNLPGVQAAVVVGPPDEPIHTDAHGRVKVKFGWDRRFSNEGPRPHGCWVRVMQSWAGSAYGSVVLPRVGMEVLVAFIDGPAQRPMVIGCAYNGTNLTPYDLPAEKSRLVLRTRSTPSQGSDAYSELSVEDAAGQEEIFVQAERNFRCEVKHDRTVNIGHDASLAVGGKQTIAVKSDDSLQVGAERTVAVAGNEHHTVDQDRRVEVGGSQFSAVTGSAAYTVEADCSLRVAKQASLHVAGALDVHGQLAARATFADKADLDISKHFAIRAASLGLAAKDTMVFEQGNAKIVLKGGEVHISAKAIRLNGKTIKLESTGALTLKGKSVSSN